MDPHDGELDPRFSSPDATATPWATARDVLAAAPTYWLSTVRSDGDPHVTTIAGVWIDEALHFTTGPSEQKAKNLAAGNVRVVVTTGCNGWDGLDIVVEGEAVRVLDAERLGRLVNAFRQKYADFFGFRLVEGRIVSPGATDEALAFEVRARKVLGFAKGGSFGQTRWLASAG
jgi:hypothetical protein